MSKIKVNNKRVSCDGGEDGHPIIYLEMEEGEGKIACPYCGTMFYDCTVEQHADKEKALALEEK